MSEQHVSPEQLVDYLHHELPPGEDAAVHAHLADCQECRQAYDAEVQLSELLRGHASSQERDLPQGVVASIREAVAAAQQPWWARLAAWVRPLAVGTAVAAGVLVGAFLGLRGTHSHAQAATIDAAYYIDDHTAMSATTPFDEGAALPATLSEGVTESEEQPAVDETH